MVPGTLQLNIPPHTVSAVGKAPCSPYNIREDGTLKIVISFVKSRLIIDISCK